MDGSSGAHILVLNAGSSSVKFAVFSAGDQSLDLSGKIERLGLPGTQLMLTAKHGSESTPVSAADHAACLPLLIDVLKKENRLASISGVGHRIVHGGMKFHEPIVVTPEVLDELHRLAPLAPEHLPAEISLIEAISKEQPQWRQAVCFDTGFHSHMPDVAKRLPIPRRYFAQGVRKFGFHGISYSFLLDELRRLAGDHAARGRVILAHLGNGASMAAISGGQCIDTTMGFTPAAGLMMATRSGDLDPGLAAYLARTEGLAPDGFDRMINKESGLLGLSETSPDVRDLLAREASDPRAKEALELYCYIARKWIGALSASLGGLDTLVFSGGIGENAAVIRERICAKLDFLGVVIDPQRNAVSAPVISPDGGRANVRVIKTDEELWIARASLAILKT